MVTVQVEISGIKHVPGNSFALATLTSTDDDSEASTQLLEIDFGEGCSETDNMCGHAQGSFADVEPDIKYHLIVCHTRRRTESGCQLGSDGQTIGPGEVREITPTQESASYTFNLENNY